MTRVLQLANMEFKFTMINMLGHVQERIDMSQQMGNFRFIDTLMGVYNGHLRSEIKYQTHTQTHTHTTTSANWINSGVDIVEEKINRNKDKATEIVQTKAQRRKQE